MDINNIGETTLNEQFNEKSHFENIEKTQNCLHIEHRPPMHLYIPHGQQYVHVCPGCNKRTVLKGSQITF